MELIHRSHHLNFQNETVICIKLSSGPFSTTSTDARLYTSNRSCIGQGRSRSIYHSYPVWSSKLPAAETQIINIQWLLKYHRNHVSKSKCHFHNLWTIKCLAWLKKHINKINITNNVLVWLPYKWKLPRWIRTSSRIAAFLYRQEYTSEVI